MDRTTITTRRLANQYLIGRKAPDLLDVVRHLGAVQAQDYPGARWAIGRRTTRIRDTDVDAELASGTLVRTHVLRPTWHLTTSEDIRWLLELTGPRVQQGSAGRYRQLELDPATLRKGSRLMLKALEGGNHLTRNELAEVLTRGRVDIAGQRMPYLLMNAELEQIICSGPRKGKHHSYAAFDERVPALDAPFDRDRAVVELTRRYFASHGPATPHDFAWWSGLTVTDGRHGLEKLGDEVVATQTEVGTYFALRPAKRSLLRSPQLHLLPNYDEYVGSYRDYWPVFDRTHLGIRDQTDVFNRHIVVLDGQVIGGWRRSLHGRSVDVETNVLVRLRRAEHDALEREVATYARFVGKELGELTRRNGP
ncbi:MAG: winged helix DNA-binding domain-containing protein [Actinomycetota bacterium]